MTSSQQIVLSRASTPDVVTKNLSFNWVNGKRRARLSSNFIRLMGFDPDQRISARQNDGGALSGFYVEPDNEGSHKVHTREYNRVRSNNPLESVVEFSGQSFLDSCFPSYTERFHVEMRNSKLIFTPMANRVHAIHQRFANSKHRNAFVALTGGVDIHCLEQLGWKASVVLEHRPMEARDRAQGRNLTEVHALNTLVNGSPSILINEDIYQLDINCLTQLLSEAEPILMCHFSIACDDESTAKSKKAKEKSVEDLTTVYDMVYPVLKQIEAINAPIVCVENVRSFKSSAAGVILSTTLRRLGYHVTEDVVSALDFGGKQGRTRYYMVASIWPGFKMPEVGERDLSTLKKIIEEHLPDCSDVTGSKSILARETKSRNMPPFITTDSTYCPTILKSQDRGLSDAIYVQHEGRILKPSIGMIKDLMSIPADFDASWMAKEQATETLGQSIDYRLHHSIMKEITEHVKMNTNNAQLVSLTR